MSGAIYAAPVPWGVSPSSILLYDLLTLEDKNAKTANIATAPIDIFHVIFIFPSHS
jgi:hypothetical protein